MTAVAGLVGVALALAAHLGPREDATPAPGIPLSVGLKEPLDIGALGTALLGSLATALGVATTAQTLCQVHHQRTRRYEDKLEADAAASVRAVSGSYSRPLKRKKLAAFLESHPVEWAAAPGALSELQHHAQLFSRYSLALKLTADESDYAHGAAVDLLSEEYEHEKPERLAHAVRKAHSLAKAGEQGTLTELALFIEKPRASPTLGFREVAPPGMG